MKIPERFEITGVIEGFYGTPWRHAQRLNLLNRMAQWNLNTYLYAPKFDLRHRLQWQDPYPRKTLDEFEELHKATETLIPEIKFGDLHIEVHDPSAGTLHSISA